MVHKEVMKKTKTYGLIALLLAIVLVAMIYAYGNTGISPAAPRQPGSSQGTQGTPSQGTLGTQTLGTQASLQTFNSYDELKNFLNQSGSSDIYNSARMYFGSTNGMAAPAAVPAPTTAASAASLTSQTSANDHSTTNIQVAGVDEADTVKTDGQYIYVIGNNSQAVYILDASNQNPQNAKVLSKIPIDNGVPQGIYLSTDGSKLAVLGSSYVPYQVYGRVPGFYPANIMFPSWTASTNFVYVYDVSNKANPVLSRNFTMSGSYVDSRLIGNYVYDIISENAYLLNGTVLLPTVFSGQQPSAIAPTSIYYVNNSDTGYMYTTMVALNIENDQEQGVSTTILMGNAGSIYVSQSNIYLTDQVTTYQPIKTAAQAGAGTTIMPMPIMPVQLYSQGTVIYRIQISGPSLTLAAQGNVTGTVMSQYSMDEYNGYFRIATTSYDYSSTSYTATQQNNLYILDSNLQVVGKIENLASGESLHAARFIADRCYLVTFNQIDPLFVVDLSQPTSPIVLGNLTMPGYSDFLQPYDATHLIGIGQDVNASIDANKVETPGDVYYTAVLGLKVSLFDVSNVANPQETSSVTIGNRGTTSEALTDPKAILFDASRNLLVLPVELYLLNNSTATASPGATGTAGTGTTVPAPAPMIPASPYYYPQFVWQGVYVFNIDLTNGITIKGNITQLDNASAFLANPSLAITSSYPWGESQYFITRSLYIGNVLYTVSQSRVQLNSLSNFALLAKVDLN